MITLGSPPHEKRNVMKTARREYFMTLRLGGKGISISIKLRINPPCFSSAEGYEIISITVLMLIIVPLHSLLLPLMRSHLPKIKLANWVLLFTPSLE